METLDSFSKQFLALDGNLNLNDYILCDYVFQTPANPLDAALDLCKSQSTSSAGWGESARVDGETEEIVGRFGAKLLYYEIIGESSIPDLPLVNDFQKPNDGIYRRVKVSMALPARNLAYNIPILFTAAAGEIHYLPGFVSVKWTDVHFPSSYLEGYKGPSFGAEGMRQLSSTTPDDPLIIAVVKPSLVPPKQFAELVYQAAVGGAQMVKEDELLVDIIDSPLEIRVKLAAEAIHKAENKLGRKIFYQPNITGDVADLQRNYEVAVENGANSVMVNGVAIGLSAVKMVTSWSKVPVASHFDLTACMAKVPYQGISHRVLAKCHRLAGIDNLVVPSFGRTMMEYESDIFDELTSCVDYLGNIKPSLPLLGGGLKATNVGYVLNKAGTNNVGLIVGHGIYGHPDGPTAGTRSIVQAVEAYKHSIDAREYAKTHPELSRAIEKWDYTPY
ncbi:MAG: hypothetical protein HYT77_08040 [Deltaproteobacteria bacterium]|nr:hypothetical protein [Deltaproteobacteria bacterium]